MIGDKSWSTKLDAKVKSRDLEIVTFELDFTCFWAVKQRPFSTLLHCCHHRDGRRSELAMRLS